MTPLKGIDNQVYAVAQGSLVIGGAGASSAGSSVQINHLGAGRISAGAIVERAVPTLLGQGSTSTWNCTTLISRPHGVSWRQSTAVFVWNGHCTGWARYPAAGTRG